MKTMGFKIKMLVSKKFLSLKITKIINFITPQGIKKMPLVSKMVQAAFCYLVNEEPLRFCELYRTLTPHNTRLQNDGICAIIKHQIIT